MHKLPDAALRNSLTGFPAPSSGFRLLDTNFLMLETKVENIFSEENDSFKMSSYLRVVFQERAPGHLGGEKAH